MIFNKQKYDVTFPLDNTVLKLKDHIQTLTGRSCNNLFEVKDFIILGPCQSG